MLNQPIREEGTQREFAKKGHSLPGSQSHWGRGGWDVSRGWHMSFGSFSVTGKLREGGDRPLVCLSLSCPFFKGSKGTIVKQKHEEPSMDMKQEAFDLLMRSTLSLNQTQTTTPRSEEARKACDGCQKETVLFEAATHIKAVLRCCGLSLWLGLTLEVETTIKNHRTADQKGLATNAPGMVDQTRRKSASEGMRYPRLSERVRERPLSDSIRP